MHKHFTVLVLLLTLAACAPRLAPSLTEAASRYRPARVAGNMQARPGIIAWSPDGTHLAFAARELAIFDASTGGKKMYPLENLQYLAWSPEGTLYALCRGSEGRTILFILDPGSSDFRQVPLDVTADAVYPGADGKSLMLLEANVQSLPFGSAVTVKVTTTDLAGKNRRAIYSSSKTSMLRKPNVTALTAWIHAGLNPLDHALLVMEHTVPPNASYYTKILAIDPITGEISDRYDRGAKNGYLSAHWSPDGMRAVVTDGEGHLEIRDRKGRSKRLDPSLTGIFPSWNPSGSRIYVGGSLIDSAGGHRETLLEQAADSIGQWSPDGRQLAVVAGGELLLFKGIEIGFIAPDGPCNRALSEKIASLGELCVEGLLSHEEYRSRRDGMILRTGEEK